MPKGDRFEKFYEQGSGTYLEIWVDKVTGVNYLCLQSDGFGGGITPLLDANGNIVVTK